MSNNKQEVEFHPLKEMCIDIDDIKNIRDFFNHFSIPMDDKLEAAMVDLETALKESNKFEELLVKQNNVRVRLCVVLWESQSPLFQDEIFKEVRDNAKHIAFIGNFEDQLKELVTDLNP
jgi:hypothetical protein